MAILCSVVAISFCPLFDFAFPVCCHPSANAASSLLSLKTDFFVQVVAFSYALQWLTPVPYRLKLYLFKQKLKAKCYSFSNNLLDPYSKIGAIWGALAQAYLTRQLPDSATWAFAQGKKHGGFTEPILTYNRQLLNSCDSNAILITVGDNITFSCWYLQTIEHYRGDVTIVDANLVNTSWYPVYLKNSQRLAIGYNARELDTLSYFNWTERPITITNPANSSESFTWLLKPTYYGGYLLKGDRILLDILKHNLYSRTVYFSDGTDSTYNLFLDDYLTGDGIVTRLRLQPNDLQTATTLVSPNFEKYNISQLDPGTIVQSRDAVAMLNAFRYAFYNL